MLGGKTSIWVSVLMFRGIIIHAVNAFTSIMIFAVIRTASIVRSTALVRFSMCLFLKMEIDDSMNDVERSRKTTTLFISRYQSFTACSSSFILAFTRLRNGNTFFSNSSSSRFDICSSHTVNCVFR